MSTGDLILVALATPGSLVGPLLAVAGVLAGVAHVVERRRQERCRREDITLTVSVVKARRDSRAAALDAPLEQPSEQSETPTSSLCSPGIHPAGAAPRSACARCRHHTAGADQAPPRRECSPSPCDLRWRE